MSRVMGESFPSGKETNDNLRLVEIRLCSRKSPSNPLPSGNQAGDSTNFALLPKIIFWRLLSTSSATRLSSEFPTAFITDDRFSVGRPGWGIQRLAVGSAGQHGLPAFGFVHRANDQPVLAWFGIVIAHEGDFFPSGEKVILESTSSASFCGEPPSSGERYKNFNSGFPGSLRTK